MEVQVYIMNNVFAITSGKGGVGKSTVATCIAAAAQRLGKRVLLIDLDEGLRCLDVMTGISESVVLDLADVFNGEAVENAVYPLPEHNGVYLLPAPALRGGIEDEVFGELIRQVAKDYDMVIADFPAGIDMRLYKQMPDTTRFITVTGPDPVSIRDAGVVADNLEAIGKMYNRLIINRFDYSYIKSGVYKGVDDIIDSSRIQLIGIVPNDITLTLNQAKGKIAKRGRAVKAFNRIIKRLEGEDVPLPKAKRI